MKKLMLTIVVLSLFTVIFAETVVLKDGRELHGEIVAKQGENIYLQKDADLYLIEYGQIEKIKTDSGRLVTRLIFIKNNFNTNDTDLSKATIMDVNAEMVELYDKEKKETAITKINWANLTAAGVFGALAFDRFSNISLINNSIDSYEDNEFIDDKTRKKMIDDLEKQRGRCILIGSLSALATVVNLKYSFEKLDLKVSPVEVSVSYSF